MPYMKSRVFLPKAFSPAWPWLFPLVLGVAALVSVTAFHWSAFHSTTNPRLGDMWGIVRGYHQAPDVWADGLKWWYGGWINTGQNWFRPLSSYLHWFQVDLIARGNWSAAIAINVALYSLACFWAGLLALRVTQSRACAAAAAVVMAAIPMKAPAAGYPLQGVAPHTDALAWIPTGDNLLCMAFFAPAVLAFLAWNESGSRRHYAAALALMMCAALSKEFAYILPAFFVAVVLYASQPEDVNAKLKHLAIPFLLIAGLVMWRTEAVRIDYLIGGPFAGLPVADNFATATVKLYTSFQQSPGAASVTRDAGFVALGAGVIKAGAVFLFAVTMWRFRRYSLSAMLAAFVILSYAPLTRVYMGDSHRWPFLFTWLIGLATFGVLEIYRQYLPAWQPVASGARRNAGLRAIARSLDSP